VKPARAAALAAIAAVLVLAAVVAWLAHLGLDARRHLLAAREAALRVEHALLAGDPAQAHSELDRVQREVADARSDTSGPLWWLAKQVPYAGRTPRTVTGLVAAVGVTADAVLPDLVRAGEALDPTKVSATRIDLALQPLLTSHDSLAAAGTRLAEVRRSLTSLPSYGVIRPVDQARTRVVNQLATLATDVSRAQTAVALAPDILGWHGPRRYLLAMQNNAESRGTGGLMGIWGILAVDDGRPRLAQLGTIEDLPTTPVDVSALGAGYTNLYGDDPALWANANESPNFPDAAQLWLAMWRHRTGVQLDGVIAIDPVGLSYLMKVIGPVTMSDGTRITARTEVSVVEQQAYDRFPDNAARKRWLRELSRSVFTAMQRRHYNSRSLLLALARGARQQRVLAYSAHPTEQSLLADSPLAGTLPQGPGPFVSVVVDNAAGNKLDYYLRRRLTYALGTCTAGARRSTVTVQLFNDVPARPLPAYVTTRHDAGGDRTAGSSKLLVYVVLTQGAAVTGVHLDGVSTHVVTGSERGHPVVELPVELRAHQTRQIVLHLLEPAYPQRPTVRVQPLVAPQQTDVIAQRCGS